MNFPRPRIVVSRCLGFEACRWNGQTVSSPAVDLLREHVDCITPCPESDLGLGIPREPIRVVEGKDGRPRLLQNATERDLTEDMEAHIEALLDGLGPVDGFVLKHKSPSCGLGNVRVYPGLGKVQALHAKGQGFFGRIVSERYAHLPLEDEGRMKNFVIRDHFLTRIYAQARLRTLRASGRMKDLVAFHASNKYLLMAYNTSEKTVLGRIVANPEKRPLDAVLDDYDLHFRKALARPPRRPSMVNALMHVMGHFSKQLTSREKAFVLDTLERYRSGRVPLSVPLHLLKGFVERWDNDYLAKASFFEPYPEALMELGDSGKGRDL